MPTPLHAVPGSCHFHWSSVITFFFAVLCLILLCHDFVNFLHDALCLLEHVDDAAIVLHVFETESHALAVFQPLLRGLIASDVELPGRFWHTLEVLLRVDIDAIVLPTIAINLQRASYGEGDACLWGPARYFWLTVLIYSFRFILDFCYFKL